jgi:DNA-binding transcriptional LysR family regulator
MDIHLTGLLVFRHVAETGSFTEAAKFWKISQPTVSTLIARLETSVSLILLERASSGTQLTPAGIQFLKWANEVCEAYLTFNDGIRTLGRRMDRSVCVGIDHSSFGQEVREILMRDGKAGGINTTVCDLGEAWWNGLGSSQYDVVVAGRFLQSGLSPNIQEGVMRREKGITVAWNPDFYPFDPADFSFPEALRTTVLIPDASVITGFYDFLMLWCDNAYGFRPANVLSFSSELDAAKAAIAGLGVFLGGGDAIPRLGGAGQALAHVRTFEFLLPEAFTFGVYCRGGEDSKEVLTAAAAISRIGKTLGAH